MSDESLLAGMAGGDEDAATAFVRRFQSRVYGLALTIVRDPALAEEVAQEAFVKAWRHAATYDGRRGRVVAWLLTVTRNAAIDKLRYRHEDPIDPDLLTAVLGARDRADDGDDQVTSLALRQALAELPLEQSRPIVLMTFYGLTADEIGRRDGTPVGTVKSRVRRGMQALRQRWEVRDG